MIFNVFFDVYNECVRALINEQIETK